MPARVPDTVKAARGTLRESRTAAGRAAARPAPVVVWRIPSRCPDAEAPCEQVIAWSECAAAVNAAGTACKADKPAFAALVEARALALRAAAILRTEGVTLSSGDGVVKAHPAATLWAQSNRAFMDYAARFGITPADRDRAAPLGTGQGAADALSEFASGAPVRLVKP